MMALRAETAKPRGRRFYSLSGDRYKLYNVISLG